MKLADIDEKELKDGVKMMRFPVSSYNDVHKDQDVNYDEDDL